MALNREADMVFCLDGTSSTQSVFKVMKEHIKKICEDFHHENPMVHLQYGVVVFRDPVNRRHEDSQNEILPLTESLEEVEAYLGRVKASGGGDDQEDWAGGLDMALHRMQWRKGKKMIFLISDADAHGSRFSGLDPDPHENQSERLEGLVREMADKSFYFSAINVRKNGDGGCERTLDELRGIYNRAPFHKEFHVESVEVRFPENSPHGPEDFGPGVRDEDMAAVIERLAEVDAGEVLWTQDGMNAFEATLTASVARGLAEIADEDTT